MAKKKYTDDFPLLAEDFARRGMIDEEIWKSLGIGKSTYYKYQLKYGDFMDAIKKGKSPVDVKVENALLKRALGFEYEEIKIEYKPGKKKKGEEDEELGIMKSITKTKKLIVGDVTAEIFWSKNRRPHLWKDKHDVSLGGNLNVTVISAVPRPKPRPDKEEKNGQTKK